MIADLHPYPAMKDSGVPWLGEVPAHWEVHRLRRAVEMRVSNVDKHTKEDEQPVRLCNYVDVYKNERITERLSFMRATATADEIERFRLQLGDVLITKDSETWNDIGVPALVEHAAEDLVCGYHLALLRPRQGAVDGDFLLRLLQCRPVAYQFHVAANGVTRYGLSHGAIKSVALPIPPPPEQLAITRFLIHADRRIRRYIRAKQKLIALLNEQKQAIIHRAVTRGLDPSVPMKSSGVEWLGDVPEHWEVQKIRYFARVGNGSTPSRGNPAYWSGGRYPWLNSSYANRDSVTQADQFVTDTALRECHLPIVPSGSVLVAITGQGKTRGKATVLQIEATINQHMGFITPRATIASPGYLQLALSGAYRELRSISDDSGSTKGALTCAALKHFKVALPPIAEQAVVLASIDSETRLLNSAIDRAEAEITLLHELRTRLIADVVTGKLDVREAAARLPDEGEESEALDDLAALAVDEGAEDTGDGDGADMGDVAELE